MTKLFAGDIGNVESVKNIIDFSNESLGGIDILVNNAGLNIANRRLSEMSIEDWNKVIQVILDLFSHV